MEQNPTTNEELSAQLEKITTLLTNLVTTVNILTVARGANPPTAAHPAATAIAFTPGVAASNNLIDFSTRLVLHLTWKQNKW